MARKTRRTLRKMTPLSRELARLGNELQSINTRLMNLTGKVARVEALADAAEGFMVSVGAETPEQGA